MILIRTAGHLAKESTTLAVHAARHPIGTALGAVGLARGITRGVVGLGTDLLRGHPGHPAGQPSPAAHPAPTEEPAEAPTEAPADVSVTPEQDSEPSLVEEERANLPGPDLFTPPPTDPADLPEPIVITAEDETGEAFQTEPKAASRVSAHEGDPGDREEAEGYVEEIPDPEDQPGLQG